MLREILEYNIDLVFIDTWTQLFFKAEAENVEAARGVFADCGVEGLNIFHYGSKNSRENSHVRYIKSFSYKYEVKQVSRNTVNNMRNLRNATKHDAVSSPSLLLF